MTPIHNTPYAARLTPLLLFGILCLLNSCATIVAGTEQRIFVQTDPPDAQILVDGKHMGQTPTMLRLNRKSSQHLVLRKEGYDPLAVDLMRTYNKLYFWNIAVPPPLIGLLIGLYVDSRSGAAYILQPEDIHVRLNRTFD